MICNVWRKEIKSFFKGNAFRLILEIFWKDCERTIPTTWMTDHDNGMPFLKCFWGAYEHP